MSNDAKCHNCGHPIEAEVDDIRYQLAMLGTGEPPPRRACLCGVCLWNAVDDKESNS